MIFVCMCVLCVCVCVCFVCICVGQRSTLSAIFEVLFTLGFETGSLIDPELTIRPSSLRDYSVSTASGLDSQACSTIPAFFFFLMWILGIKRRSSCSRSKHFSDKPISPAPLSIPEVKRQNEKKMCPSWDCKSERKVWGWLRYLRMCWSFGRSVKIRQISNTFSLAPLFP